MKTHRILGSGAIACSAVVATQWIPSFAVPLPDNLCQTGADPQPADAANSTKASSEKCSLSDVLSGVETLPEQVKMQWSQYRAAQVPGSMERKYEQLVEQAQTLASENRISEAIVLVNAIPKNSRHSEIANQLQETWSQETLQQASSHYKQAQLSPALKLLEAIPDTSSQYSKATQLRQKWRQDAVQLHQAIVASKEGAWQDVIYRLEAIKDTPLFQSSPVQQLWQVAMTRGLEPDPSLVQLASTMSSTSLSAASIPSASIPAASSLSTSLPPMPASSTSSNLSREVQRVLNPPVVLPQAAKQAKPARQAVTARSAPDRMDSPSANARQSGSLISIASTVTKSGK